jgi:hypothetical protein
VCRVFCEHTHSQNENEPMEGEIKLITNKIVVKRDPESKLRLLGLSEFLRKLFLLYIHITVYMVQNVYRTYVPFEANHFQPTGVERAATYGHLCNN